MRGEQIDSEADRAAMVTTTESSSDSTIAMIGRLLVGARTHFAPHHHGKTTDLLVYTMIATLSSRVQ